MGKSAVSRDAFRGLFALYAARAHCNHNGDGEARLLKLFGSCEYIPDDLLELWSTRPELIGPATVGDMLSPLARQIAEGVVLYHQASDFLHGLLREMESKLH